jgi:hypothetical protein
MSRFALIESLTNSSKQLSVIVYSIRLGSIICGSSPGVGWVLGSGPPPSGLGFSVVLLSEVGGIGAEGCETKPGWGMNIPGGGMVYPDGDG